MPLRPAALLLILTLAACAAGRAPPAAPGPPSARQALVASAERGPVLATIRGELPGLEPARRDSLVADALARGVRGLSLRFTTDAARAAAPEPHLEVFLNPASEAAALAAACRRAEEVPVRPVEQELRVFAAFCEGERLLGDVATSGAVSGPDDRRLERLLWRTARQLFPDDYAETYGFGILPPWLGVGVGGSVGF